MYDMLPYSTLLHVPPVRLHCVGGCWDQKPRTVATLALTALTTRLDLIQFFTQHIFYYRSCCRHILSASYPYVAKV
jgi:hypothetical protein